MGFLRKVGKKIKKVFKKIGKAIKKGFGKVAKAFGKLGPLGSIALSFLLPGIGNMLSGWLGNMGKFGKFIMDVGSKIKQGATWIKDGVGTVFNKVSDAIEFGMNKVSQPFMKEGARGMGSAFRDFVSDVTGGFIDPSKEANLFDKDLALKTKDGKLLSELTGDELKVLDASGELDAIKASADLGRSQSAFMRDEFRTVSDKEGFTPNDLKLKKDEVYGGFNEATKQHEIFKSQEAFDKYAGGTFDSAVGGLTPEDMIAKATDSKKSIWDGKQKDQSIREYIGDSKEAGVYKKVGALSTYGMTQMEGEAQIAAYNARVKKDKADYFTDVGLDSLANRTNYSVTQPANFIDTTTFDIGKDLNDQFLMSMNIQGPKVSGFDVGGYGTTYEDVIEKLATA